MARILIIAGDGTVCDHLDYGYFRMLEEGFDVTIAAPVKRGINTAVHQGEPGMAMGAYAERPGYIMQADAALDEVEPTTFDALLLPGWRSAEYLRNIKSCCDVVRHFLITMCGCGRSCL